MTSRERRIREIAYHLWEQEGRPEGESHSHRLWLAAEAQFEAENRELEGAGIDFPVESSRPAKGKTDARAVEKPTRSAKAKAAEPAPETSERNEKARPAKAKAEEPTDEKAGKRKSKAK